MDPTASLWSIPAAALALRLCPAEATRVPLSSLQQGLALLRDTAAQLTSLPAAADPNRTQATGCFPTGPLDRQQAAELCSAALGSLHQLRKAACPDQACPALLGSPSTAAAVADLLQQGVHLLAAAAPVWALSGSSQALQGSHACSVAAMLVAVQHLRLSCSPQACLCLPVRMRWLHAWHRGSLMHLLVGMLVHLVEPRCPMGLLIACTWRAHLLCCRGPLCCAS